MGKIRSTKELVYDGRSLKQGIIEIEVSNWSFDINQKRYTVKVDDYLVYNENELECRLSINSKYLYFTDLEVNNLVSILSINEQLNYTEKLKELTGKALLYINQSEPVYGSMSNDWIEVNEPIEIL